MGNQNGNENEKARNFTAGTLIACCAAAFVLGYAVTAFTPLRNTVPGYPDAKTRREAISNAIRIDSLQNKISQWEMYATNLSRVLKGEATISIDTTSGGTSEISFTSIKSREELSVRDSLLRRYIEDAEKAGMENE